MKTNISNKRTLYQIRNASDRLCRESGLSIVKPVKQIEYTDKDGQRRTRPAKEQGRSYAEYAADKAGGSWKGKLKIAIDTTIPQSSDFEDFLRRMEAAGYEIKRGKYISFRAHGQERFTHSKTLGEDYTVERITERIQGRKRAVSAPKRDSKTVGLVIDIENSIKAAQSKGYAQWAKIHNLKQAAKNKAQYRAAHESTLILHEAAAKALKAVQAGGGKLPNVATLQAEYARLTKEKEALYAEYGKLKKQMKEYGVIKQNVDSILQHQPDADKAKERDAQL